MTLPANLHTSTFYTETQNASTIIRGYLLRPKHPAAICRASLRGYRLVISVGILLKRGRHAMKKISNQERGEWILSGARHWYWTVSDRARLITIYIRNDFPWQLVNISNVQLLDITVHMLDANGRTIAPDCTVTVRRSW